jgi:hypothetical protein
LVFGGFAVVRGFVGFTVLVRGSGFELAAPFLGTFRYGLWEVHAKAVGWGIGNAPRAFLAGGVG